MMPIAKFVKILDEKMSNCWYANFH